MWVGPLGTFVSGGSWVKKGSVMKKLQAAGRRYRNLRLKRKTGCGDAITAGNEARKQTAWAESKAVSKSHSPKKCTGNRRAVAGQRITTVKGRGPGLGS